MKKQFTVACLSVAALSVVLGACAKLDEAVNNTRNMGLMQDQVRLTNDQMNELRGLAREQKMKETLDMMEKPENTVYLFPPTGQLPGGKKFVEAVTPLELVELTYVYLKEVNETKPTAEETSADGKYSDAVIAKYNHKKVVKLNILQVLAGLAPQSKIDKIIEDQIYKGGEYEDTAYELLALRGMFLRDYMVKNKTLGKRISNLDKVRAAMTEIDKLEYLAKLRLPQKIEFKTLGMLGGAEAQLSDEVTPTVCQPLWEQLSERMDAEVAPRFLTTTGKAPANARALSAIISPEAAQLKAQIQSRLSAYTGAMGAR